MYVEAILIGLIIGFIRNGRINNFFEVKFKGWSLSIIAFLMFLAPFGIEIFKIPFENIQLFPFISMGIVALIALMNFEKNGMKVILIGIALNMLIMGLNDLRMPVDTIKMQALGLSSFVESLKSGYVVNYMSLEGSHALSGILGKVIAIPKAYPFSKVLSIGDIFVSIGIIMTIQNEMLIFSSKSKGSMLQFTYNSRGRK